MNVIFPVAPVVERLQHAVPQLKLVGVMADLGAALKTPPNVACAAYVVQSTQADVPQWSTGDDAYAQSAYSAIQVVPWVRNYAKARTGAGARGDMDTLINAIADAVVGFAPEEFFRPLWFRTATDEFYDAAWLVSQVVFQSEFEIGR